MASRLRSSCLHQPDRGSLRAVRPLLQERGRGAHQREGTDRKSTSFPELGIAGPDSAVPDNKRQPVLRRDLQQLRFGGDAEAELQILFGVYESHEHYMGVQEAIGPLVDELFEENSEGGKVISHMWISGADQFFFCKEPIATLADFEGRKVRSHVRPCRTGSKASEPPPSSWPSPRYTRPWSAACWTAV